MNNHENIYAKLEEKLSADNIYIIFNNYHKFINNKYTYLFHCDKIFFYFSKNK